MEREQKPKQWTDDCSKCEKKYTLNTQNTLYVYFEKQEECSYLVCKCPDCGNSCIIFDSTIGPNDALARDIEVDDSDRTAGEAVYGMWCELKGIVLPPAYETTQRHEKLISGMGETLTAVLEKAPDLFWDEMNSPNSYRPYPQRWI